MTSNYGGNHVYQYGVNSIGTISSTSSHVDPQIALQEMMAAVHALRDQVHPAERRVIDDSMRVISASNGAARPAALRQALAGIAGIATVVGDVGVPVVEAVRKVIEAFGM